VSRDRQPPQLIGLGPDSTPPGGTDVGTTEQRTLGGVVDIAGKVDALQVDVRGLAVGQRALIVEVGAVHQSQGKLLGELASVRDHVDGADVRVRAEVSLLAQAVRATGKQAGEATRAASRAAGAVDGLNGRVMGLEHEVTSMRASIGEAANPSALARASSVDLSPEAIAALELGTGLRRDIAELRVHHEQAALRAGREAGEAAGKVAGKQAGTRGAVLGGGGVVLAMTAIQHADKLEHLIRTIFGG
jgi:hypothetical protein